MVPESTLSPQFGKKFHRACDLTFLIWHQNVGNHWEVLCVQRDQPRLAAGGGCGDERIGESHIVTLAEVTAIEPARNGDLFVNRNDFTGGRKGIKRRALVAFTHSGIEFR